MIQAGNYPITVRRGDTGYWDFHVEDVDTSDPSNPIVGDVDITNWTIKAQAKWDQNTIWFEFPIIKTFPLEGKFQFYIGKALSETVLPVGTLPPDSSSYELQVEFEEVLGSGQFEVATLLQGTFSVIRDLVRTDEPAP